MYSSTSQWSLYIATSKKSSLCWHARWPRYYWSIESSFTVPWCTRLFSSSKLLCRLCGIDLPSFASCFPSKIAQMTHSSPHAFIVFPLHKYNKIRMEIFLQIYRLLIYKDYTITRVGDCPNWYLIWSLTRFLNPCGEVRQVRIKAVQSGQKQNPVRDFSRFVTPGRALRHAHVWVCSSGLWEGTKRQCACMISVCYLVRRYGSMVEKVFNIMKP